RHVRLLTARKKGVGTLFGYPVASTHRSRFEKRLPTPFLLHPANEWNKITPMKTRVKIEFLTAQACPSENHPWYPCNPWFKKEGSNHGLRGFHG
ncbi:MAG: hypothetical protein WD045_13380, partial [Pirellulaceae bacterium]